jgi:hypothetical protein
MGKRKIKHRFSKQQRNLQEQKVMAMSDIIEITQKAEAQSYERANQLVIDNVLPVCILYLIEHFHCKAEGVSKFLKWYVEMQDWLKEYPQGYEEIKKEIWEKASTRVVPDK